MFAKLFRKSAASPRADRGDPRTDNIAYVKRTRPDRLSERLHAIPKPDIYVTDPIKLINEMQGQFRGFLEANSVTYQLIKQLDEADLKDCTQCYRSLQKRLANEPHFVALTMLEEARVAIDRLR